MAEDSDKDTTFSMATASKSLSSDSVSMVDLKAEVVRKKEEALYNKFHGRTKANVHNNDSQKKNNIWSKSNVGVLKRNSEDAEKERKERIRVQMALEQKAEVYDKLKDGRYKDKDKLFLVNFDEDASYEIPDDDDEDDWVEYTDGLGRSRKCHKSDLPDMKKRDMDAFGEEGTTRTESEQTMLSEDMRRDLLRQKWEREEEENLAKPQLHYTDVLFDEARTHGAGHYNFSRNESKRFSEMENLKSTHNETLEERFKRDAKKSHDDAKLKARLKKVRDKKRLKMGLPALPDDDDDPIVYTNDKKINEPKDISIEDSVTDTLRSLRQKEEIDKMRNSIVREWDVGKEGVSAKAATDQDEFKEKLKITMERKVLNQKEWVDQKRSERTNEFAPLTGYDSKGGHKKSLDKSYGKKSFSNVPPPRSQAAPSTSKQSYQNMPPPPSRSGQSDFYPKNHPPPPDQSNFDDSHQFFPPNSFPGYSNENSTGNSYGVNTNVPPPGHKPHSNQVQTDSFGFCINEPQPEKKSQNHYDHIDETNEDFDPEEPLPPGFEQRTKNLPQRRAQAAPSTSKQSHQNMPPASRSSQPNFYPKNHPRPPNKSTSLPRFGDNRPRIPPNTNTYSSNQTGHSDEVFGMGDANQTNEDFDSEEPFPPGFEQHKNTDGAVSFNDRLNLHQNFNPKLINNEVFNASYSSEEENEGLEEMSKPKKGAQIAPPAQMNYYSSESKKGTHFKKGHRNGDEMAESFLCGLQSSLKRKHQNNDDNSSDSD